MMSFCVPEVQNVCYHTLYNDHEVRLGGEGMSYNRLSAGKVLPRRLQEVMNNLQEMFGNDLEVKSLNREGATFYVHNMSDKSLIREMIKKTHDIFGPLSNQTPGCVLGPSDFQILCASNPRGG